MARGYDLPIPVDAVVTPRWSKALVELADFIGAYSALLIAEAFGGTELYIPTTMDAASAERIVAVIGREKAEALVEAYPHSRPTFPVSRSALLEAKRQPVILRAQMGEITVAEAVRLTGSSRPYVSKLVNEGWSPPRKRPTLTSVLPLVRTEMVNAGVEPDVIERVTRHFTAAGPVALAQPY